MSKVHAPKFAGYDYWTEWPGDATEVYAPLCGARPVDPHVAHDADRVDCKRCLKMLAPGPEEG